jgi:hypothetical protein
MMAEKNIATLALQADNHVLQELDVIRPFHGIITTCYGNTACNRINARSAVHSPAPTSPPSIEQLNISGN